MNIESFTTWTATYRDYPITVVLHGIDRGSLEPLNHGRGIFNGYVDIKSYKLGLEHAINSAPWPGGNTFQEERILGVGLRYTRYGFDTGSIWTKDITKECCFDQLKEIVDYLIDNDIIHA